jgi:hypothetical protein
VSFRGRDGSGLSGADELLGWFVAKTDQDSGERLWEPKRAETGEVEFWAEREVVASQGREWSGVEDIFVKDE